MSSIFSVSVTESNEHESDKDYEITVKTDCIELEIYHYIAYVEEFQNFKGLFEHLESIRYLKRGPSKKTIKKLRKRLAKEINKNIYPIELESKLIMDKANKASQMLNGVIHWGVEMEKVKETIDAYRKNQIV